MVLKGIESSVETNEIKEALEELGFRTKSVVNIFNRDKVPQPMFRIELEPDNNKLKKSESHPIYSIQYLIHRKITVEEPHKRNRPVQCSNCQEFGHTRAYCTLRTVCVAGGDLHHSSQCDSIEKGLGKKCGNCGGNHTANYRGCPVYKELLKRLRAKQQLSKGNMVEPTFTYRSNYPVMDHDSGSASKNVSTTLGTSSQTSGPVKSGVSYNTLKSGSEKSTTPQSLGGLESLMQALTMNITSLNQNMTNFMSSMQNTIQELLRAQNQMLQILLSKK